ncbi:MAG: histidinol phosphate phosphatase domain-containing protein [Thermoplasmata archaeon]
MSLPYQPARPLDERPERYDFHAHTYCTDGEASATDMWWAAEHLAHRALAITDHVGFEDPKPLLTRLHEEARAWEDQPMKTLVGVEITDVLPHKIAEAVRRARTSGAQIVIVHGESIVHNVPPGTNRAALENGDVDVLAHPGLLTPQEAELAHAHDTILELSGRAGHSLTNGHVARLALEAHVGLVVDSDAHTTHDLIPFRMAEMLAQGAGLPDREVRRTLAETPRALLRRCGRG